jgi:hypothetical protein
MKKRRAAMGKGIVLAVLGGLVAVSLVFAVGCRGSSGPERVALSGKVTLEGKPVEDGQIRFVPQAGTVAPVTIAAIKNGAYDTAVSGGVPVGTHRVEIRAYDPKEPAPRGPGSPPRKQLVPAKYNAGTQLEITIQSGVRVLTKNFDLTD